MKGQNEGTSVFEDFCVTFIQIPSFDSEQIHQNTGVPSIWPSITFQPVNVGQQNFVILKKTDQISFSENLTAAGPLGKMSFFIPLGIVFCSGILKLSLNIQNLLCITFQTIDE